MTSSISHRELVLLPFLDLIKSVAELVRPNMKEESIYCFHHERIYKDQQAFVLSSHKDWFLSGYKNSDQKYIANYDYFDAEIKYFFWNMNQIHLKDRASAIAIASQHINVESTITAHIKTETYSDRFIFADSIQSNELKEKVINYPNFLDNFIRTYYQKAKDLIIEAGKNKFHVTHSIAREVTLPEKPFPTQAVNSYLTFLLNHLVDLTEKEYIFLVMSIYGIKSKNIAEKFYLSNRTVENRLQIARNKLQCSSTAEVFALLQKSGVFSLYFQPFLKKLIGS